ncbi:MAG: hypoxanthine phosphoribosyltransferase [Lentisphaeria bacterium]|nr:hypoxanthine phosphoribosyltransferase [Lentisphaeria bacterium]
MEEAIDSILITNTQLEERINELGAEITKHYDGKPLTTIILSHGALFFAADLLRQIPINLHVDVLQVSSYSGMKSEGLLKFRSELKETIRDRHVLVIDDIYDSGFTLSEVAKHVQKFSPISVETCVLLAKDRPGQIGDKPRYQGFDIDDSFVVGYGMDYNESYRNLPYIGVLKPEVI